jgi:hypothetical protein
MRSGLAYAALAVVGCETRLGPGADYADASTTDATILRDGSIDAPVDARPCMGGTKSAVGPDGSCLVFVATPATFNNAKAACAAMTAHLAYLKNAAIDTFAEDFVGTTNTWIGLTDRVTEGVFVWDDGSMLGFTNWHTGEPNSGGPSATYQEDCAIIAGARVDKQWDDRPCDATEVANSGSFAYLCQY